MSFTTDLLLGVAEHLASEGAGTWRPSGAYAAGETGIVIRTMPQAPDRIVSLSAYPVSDDAATNDSTVGVQLLTRSTPDPRDLEALDDRLFDALHGATSLELHGVRVVQVLRRSHAPFGQDGNGRWQSTSNFYFDVARPSRHRKH